MTLNYKSKDTPLSLIKKVGKKMISSKDIKDGKIKVKNLIITCDEIDTSKKGQYAVKFYTNDVDQKEINKSVKISDISKPEIKCDKKINITVSQIAAFNILEFINVTDNDDQEPTVKLELDKQMNGPGNYTVIVTAQDTSGNSSTKKVKIKVDADPEIPKENSDNFADKQKKTDIQENSDVSKKNPNENTSKVDKHKDNTGSTENRPVYSNPSQYDRYFSGVAISVYNDALDYAEKILRSGAAGGYSVMPTGDGYQVTFN